MEILNVTEIAKSYEGKPCNAERFAELFNKANAFHCGQCDPKTKLKFDITPALYIGWQQRGIDFRIHVSVLNGVITHCVIIKYKENYGGLYVRTPVRELKPTQQELKLFKKVMEYITSFGSE